MSARTDDGNKLTDWLNLFLMKLWLDQGLTGCHVKWTLATRHRTTTTRRKKKQRFQFIFCRQHCSRTTQKSVSNWWVRESNHITAAASPRKEKYNYEKQNLTNLEQLNTLNHGINIIKVNVGCKYNKCLLCIKCTFSRSVNLNKKKPDFTHLCVFLCNVS